MSNDAPTRRTFNRVMSAGTLGTAMHPLFDPAASILDGAGQKPSAAPGAELCEMTAVELSNRLRRKAVSAREVMTAHLAQIERINPQVNAVVTLVVEQAMAAAAKADEAMARGRAPGVLHGLPIAHKDLVDTAGIRTTRGSLFFKDHVPTEDALIVTRMRAAGALTVGKTNTPEFGAGSQTFNTVFGATCNPYDLTRTCGGSSGGAAVAVACRMMPIADGSDTGGSLRNPPAFCNVVGLRPSPGRVPGEGNSWSPLSVSGPIARTVADVALFLSAIAGPDPRNPLMLQEDGARFRAPLGKDFKKVRVAWWRGLGGIPFEPEIRRVVDSQRKVFEDLGCIVEEAEPDFTGVDEAFPILRYAANHPRYAPLVQQQPDWVKDTIKFEVAQAAAPHGGRRRPGARAANADVRPEPSVLRKVPVLRAPRDAGRALRRLEAVSNRDCRDAHEDLHRLDAIVLVRDADVESGDLGARRIHVQRPAGGAADCRPAPG